MLKTNSLTPEVLAIIRDKATEYPFTGEYNTHKAFGTYLCRQCGLALFRSQNKFTSQCGWPSFDEQIVNAVQEILDTDGRRIEILCQRCHAHLGHIFRGEMLTALNTRYCVNSASLEFVNDKTVVDTEEAIYAAGCFWGVEYYLQKLPGVLKTEVGYIGGTGQNPSYEAVCTGTTGHYEAIRVIYDPAVITYETLTKYFFEIHDPTQANGQGPDLGEQYLSAIFYYTDEQKQVANHLMTELKNKYSLDVKTKLLPMMVFWKAETYHQDYYTKTKKLPYCHSYTKRFE